MYLLEDSDYIDKYTVLKESEGGAPTYRVRGVFSRSNVVNKNNRFYPIEVMQETIELAKPLVESGSFVGEIEHPASPKINMDRISHKITKLEIMEDGAIVGEFIPAGPKKNDLISLIEDKIRFGVSTRGTGSVKKVRNNLGEEISEVLKGYQMRAIDIVHDPSAGTYPEVVSESYEIKTYFTVPNNFKAIWNDVFDKKL